MTIKSSLVVLALAVMLSSGAAVAQDYDLVILNGRVMDPETNYDAIANVGIKGDRISAIAAKSIKGKRTIDAKGLVVAPGFIDTHFHWTRPLGYKLALRDGVTTGQRSANGTTCTRASRK